MFMWLPYSFPLYDILTCRIKQILSYLIHIKKQTKQIE